MNDIFISNIAINNVRHLSSIKIPLSKIKRQHLIFTGKNGSGKTSVLEEIRQYLAFGVEQKQFNEINEWKKNIKNHQKTLEYFENRNDTNSIKIHLKNITYYQNQLSNFKNLNIEISNIINIVDIFHSGNFLLTYFNAKRTDKIKVPKGIEKFQIKDTYTQQEKANQFFLQHIVNLKADRSFARDDNEMSAVKAIDNWFNNFENWLKQLFNDEELRLKFDRKNYTFDIILKNDITVNFNTLSDGYSALLNIVMELMMRMENKTAKVYDMQGIVLIDEIETHLHIDLQKKILPFLTNVFPNIQFIVTTHSPFVLNSIENAVICDLEKKLVVEDLSAYAIDGIVEGYFDNDKYSDAIKNKVRTYENLVNKTSKTETEWEEMVTLKQYLKTIPAQLAPELVAEFQRIEYQRLTVKHH